MKNLLLFLSLFFVADLAFGQGDAPPFVQGQAQASKSVATIIQVPNNLATKTSPSRAMIELGNKNILSNPGFEHSTYSTSWTIGAGITPSAELTNVVDGKQSIFLSPGSLALDLYQDSTLYQAQFADVVQGLASVRVKTSATTNPIYVCPRRAGAYPTQMSSGCVQVQANGKWGLYRVPFNLGGTSNGIGITSNGAGISGVVYVDDAFVGAVDLKVDAQTIQTQDYVATLTSANVPSSVTKNTGSGLFSVSNVGNRIRFTALKNITVNGSGSYEVSGAGGAGAVSIWYINGNSRNVDRVVSNNNASNSGSASLNTTLLTGEYVEFEGAVYAVGAYASANVSVTATVANNVSTFTTASANTGFASCTPSGHQGFGTSPTYDLQCKRVGESLVIMGKVTATTSTAVEARLNLPLWNGVQLVSKNSSIITSIRKVGEATLSAVGDQAPTVLIEPSVSYMTFGFQGASAAGLTKQTASNWIGTGTVTFSLNATIPIDGWEESPLAVAQISGLESCATTLSCADDLSAKISSTDVVSDENYDFINGNCTNATSGQGTCTWNTGIFTVTPNCTITPKGGAQVYIVSESVTGLNYEVRTSAGTTTDSAVTINCQRTGVDAVFKSARAVASDANIATPGITKIKTCYFSFGGASSTIATPTNCTAASCVEVEDTCNIVASAPTRNSAGDYTFNVANGTFAANAIWQIESRGYSASNEVRECHQYNDTVNRTWSANSSGGGAIRFWCGSVVGGALDGAARIRIEGQAP